MHMHLEHTHQIQHTLQQLPGGLAQTLEGLHKARVANLLCETLLYGYSGAGYIRLTNEGLHEQIIC